MNILLISLYFPPDMGGASNRAWNSAMGLQVLGHRVKIIAGFPHYPKGNIPSRYREKAVVKENQGPLDVFRVWVPAIPTEGVLKRFLIYSSFMWSSLFAVFSVGKIDGIFYVSPFSSTFSVPGIFYSIIKRAKLILDVGDLWPNTAIDLGYLKSGWMVKMARLTSYVAFHLADGIAPIDDAIRDGIIREYRVARGKVHVVENGVDPQVFRPLPKNMGLLRENGLEGKFVVMYSGIFGPAYDFDVILEAAKILESHDGIRFVIRGDGERRDEIALNVRNNGIRNVLLLGKVEGMHEVLKYLNLADVFVLPMANVSVSETAIPSKVYEFLACGIPVVCCATGELAELIEGYRAGVAVSMGDGKALAAAVLSLFNDRSLNAELGRNAREAILSNFSYRAVGKKLEALFA